MMLFVVVTPALAEQRTQSFDNDPGWDALNNRIVPDLVRTATQDFGYSATNFAGKEKGEIGGKVWRSTTPASYAAEIPAKTLNDKLSASGTFALTATSGSSGAFLGFFNDAQTGGGRQDTLGFRFAGEGSGARLTLQLVTATNQACGTKVTPWIVDKTKQRGQGRKFRPTSIRNDGTRYHWTLDYDPQAAGGRGQIRFTIRSDREQHEEFEDKAFTVDLPAGYKDQRTVFDRFGLTNSMKGGNGLTIYFDDLSFDGRAEDFSKDPGWNGTGNHVAFEDRERSGNHDFGFREKSNFAEGKSAGEMGGTVWRSGRYAYYADRVGPLTLDDRLEAGGKVVLKIGAPDSGCYLGFFNSAEKNKSPAAAGSFIGIKIGGPTRVGHYFAPAYAFSAGAKADRAVGPLLVPGRAYPWKLVYDPDANDGKGAISVTLGEKSLTVPIKNGDKAKGATFDRFGLFTANIGGSYVKIYLDDLSYTSAAEKK